MIEIRAALVALGVVPTIVGYVHARWCHLRFGHGLKQFASVVVALVLAFGVFFVQAALINIFAPSSGREFMRFLVPVQYGLCGAVYFWRVAKTARQLRSQQRGADQ